MNYYQKQALQNPRMPPYYMTDGHFAFHEVNFNRPASKLKSGQPEQSMIAALPWFVKTLFGGKASIGVASSTATVAAKAAPVAAVGAGVGGAGGVAIGEATAPPLAGLGAVGVGITTTANSIGATLGVNTVMGSTTIAGLLAPFGVVGTAPVGLVFTTAAVATGGAALAVGVTGYFIYKGIKRLMRS